MDQELENYNLTAKIEHIKNKIGRKEMTQKEATEVWYEKEYMHRTFHGSSIL